MIEKYERAKKGAETNPFVDPEGYRDLCRTEGAGFPRHTRRAAADQSQQAGSLISTHAPPDRSGSRIAA